MSESTPNSSEKTDIDKLREFLKTQPTCNHLNQFANCRMVLPCLIEERDAYKRSLERSLRARVEEADEFKRARSRRTTIQSAEHAEYLQEQFDFEVEAYLRKKGWEHKTIQPGSYWMWQRELDGRLVTVNRKMAVTLQAHLEEGDCACPDEHSTEGCPIHDFKE